jgi:ribosomal protein L16/L10AE
MAPDAAKEILERASHKLPITAKFVDLREKIW